MSPNQTGDVHTSVGDQDHELDDELKFDKVVQDHELDEELKVDQVVPVDVEGKDENEDEELAGLQVDKEVVTVVCEDEGDKVDVTVELVDAGSLQIPSSSPASARIVVGVVAGEKTGCVLLGLVPFLDLDRSLV